MVLEKSKFQTINGNLKDIQIFHTDRGNEFKNQLIEETLNAFDITRSLSHKGCPYDNAVAEAIFKIIKTEFVCNQTFSAEQQSCKYSRNSEEDHIGRINFIGIGKGIKDLTFKEEGQQP